ncbi:MAG: iron uptake porin [Thermosynechococcaceae cyanobacterium]
MNKNFVLGSSLALSFLATAAVAAEPAVNVSGIQDGSEIPSPFSTFQVVQTDEEQPQVTSVSQLSDVQPTDWAFQALQSLVERYGCIAGYPDGTFRGNRAATRYELAAALNACLDQISDRFATKEDLATVKALQEEFKAELATLKGRVDGLEARAATLEAQQFSTTTKLVGEAIFQGTQFASGNLPVPSGFTPGVPTSPGARTKIGDNFTFNYRATLSLLTSFTGKDLLLTSLQQGSYENLFGTAAIYHGTLGSQVAQASNTDIKLFYLGYRFPVLNDKGTVYATAVGGELSDFVDTLNPNLDSAGQGSLSAFGLRNPIYRQVSSFAGGSNFSGTGVGFNYKFNEKLSFGAGYLVPALVAGSSVSPGRARSGAAGLFGGEDYAAIAQLTIKPIKTLGFGLTYVRSTTVGGDLGLGGYTGTQRANTPFGAGATSAHTAGVEFNWEASPRFALSGWAGISFAKAEAQGVQLAPNNPIVPDGSDGTILNFALAATFPDLFVQGNMGALIIGAEPSLISSSIPGYKDPDFPFHIEALYRFKVNDNISITPGIIAVLNPEGNSANDPVILGTIRTTFTF